MRAELRRIAAGIPLLAAAVVWLAAPELAWPARALTTFLLAILPGLILAQVQVAAEIPERLPRAAIYLSSAAALWILTGLAVAAALASGYTAQTLGLRRLDWPATLGWSCAILAGGMGLLVAGRLLRLPESALLRHLLPRSRLERLAFVGLSVSAGVGEELVFRGFAIPAIQTASASWLLALLLSSGVFGLLHAYQGAAGAVRAGILGLLLAIPFKLSGSLLPSMIGHTALDLLAGLWLADWLLRR